jgi:hypothetical protein
VSTAETTFRQRNGSAATVRVDAPTRSGPLWATDGRRCAVHGPQIQAPPSYHATCRCGRPCTVDVEDWVRTQRDQRPDENIEKLAVQAGIPPAKATAALKQRD